jgi:hypothetical protein
MSFAAYIVISLIISLIAAELLRPDPPSVDPLKEPAANNAHVRGTMLPILLGYNKVTPVIGFVGNRIAYEKKVGEIDGGMFHSDKDITQTQYRETGLHFLCIGPAYRLNKITEGGNVIFEQEITPTTHPSGSQLTCTDEDKSVFRIYWGEDGQPVDSDLAAVTGVSTRYPFTCYIYWPKKELGQQAQWKQIEYYLECSALGKEAEYIDISGAVDSVSVTRSIGGLWYSNWDAFFTTTDTALDNYTTGDKISVGSYSANITSVTKSGATYTINVSVFPPVSITGTVTAELTRLEDERRGCNPASSMEQLLFNQYPHGLVQAGQNHPRQQSIIKAETP